MPLPEALAVIGGEDDDGVLQQVLALQKFQQRAHARIHAPDLRGSV